MNINIDRRIPAFTGGFSPQQQQQRGGMGRSENVQAPRTALLGMDCVGCVNGAPGLMDISPGITIPVWAKLLGVFALITIPLAIIAGTSSKKHWT